MIRSLAFMSVSISLLIKHRAKDNFFLKLTYGTYIKISIAKERL